MLAALDHRGLDGRRMLLRRSAALGHQHFWTTPEEVGEEQPLSDDEAGIDLVFDGRLDNRDELLAALGLCSVSSSDADLALRAYQRWGADCFARLLGPFAVVVLDGRARRLVAARDGMGSRTLYYRCIPGTALVASEECALLAHPEVRRRLDEATMAQFFAVAVPRDGSTFFAEITELVPASVLVVSAEGVRLRRYWNPDVSGRVEYRTDREYAEQFRSFLSESVRCRLRTVGSPGIMLSGGMDSTSVAALAAEELDSRSAGPLLSFSWVFDELTACDERRWIGKMVERFGLDATYVPGDDAWPLRDVDRWPVGTNQPWHNCFELLKQGLYSAAVGRRCRTLLNPVFADRIYTGDEEWLTDLLREGRLLDAVRQLLGVLRDKGIRTGVEAGIRRLGKNLLRGPVPDSELHRQRLPWLTDRGHRLVAQRPSSDDRASDARRPEQFEALFGPLASLQANLAQHTHARGIELRDPFRDRRLVEFSMGLPAHQLFRPGRLKYVQRRAMSPLLPTEVSDRTAYTGLEPLFRRGLFERGRERAAELLARKDAIWRDYVSENWLRESLQTPDAAGGRTALVPWQCISAQLWIDRIESRRVA
jgi:asparagine synthase (glutamine-hydrolysing)